MKKRIYRAIRKTYPQFGYKKSDIYISSYPKSGRNWVLFLLANIFLQHSEVNKPVNFHNIDDWISHDFPERPPEMKIKTPRIVAKHEKYKGQNTKTIYIMRNPIDVMSSYYNFLIKRKNKNIKSVHRLVRSENHGIKAWSEHITSWEKEWNLYIKYEDLKKDARSELKKLLDIIGIERNTSEDKVKKALNKSSFESMRKVENKWGLPKKDGKNPNFQFMKKGRTKNTREKLNSSDYEYIRNVAGKTASKYGYDL